MMMDLFTGISLSLFLQNEICWLTLPMQLLSILGMAEIYFFLVPAIFWCYDPRLGIRLALITSLGAWFNDILKLIFHLPRPYFLSHDVKMLDIDKSFTFGFPSGHAQIPISFLGLIGYWLKKPLIWVLIVILLVGIGISRIFLGVHFSLDVISGWVFGLIMLFAVILLDRPVSTFVERWSGTKLIISGFIISFVMVGVHKFIEITNTGFQIPEIWVSIDQGLSLSHTFFSSGTSLLTAGFFFGVVIGSVLSRNSPQFDPSGSLKERIGRYLIGMIVLAIIWVSVGLIIHLQSDPGNSVLNWIRGAFLGVWIIYGAPYVFHRIIPQSP